MCHLLHLSNTRFSPAVSLELYSEAQKLIMSGDSIEPKKILHIKVLCKSG